jgi:hypothetical protein
MLLHGCYDALLKLLVNSRVGREGDTPLPAGWLAAGLAGAALGAGLILRGRPAEEAGPAPPAEPAAGEMPA